MSNITPIDIRNMLNIIMYFNIYTIYKKVDEKVNTKFYIKDLKIDKYYKCKTENIYCSICCNTVKYTEFIRKLPCKHTYHKKCVDKWLISLLRKSEKMNCPLCRKNII